MSDSPRSDVVAPQVLHTATSAMREGLQIIDREWRYAYINEAAAAHGRRTVEELTGRTMMECYPGIEETPLFDALSTCMAGGDPQTMRNAFTYPDGATRTFELRVEPCEAGIIILSIDVTEGLKLEQQLRHAQKMEAIGRLAGSVAHDFNNLLTVILSHSELMLDELSEVDPMRREVEPVRWAGRRAAELTRQLLAFSRHQVQEPALIDLNDTLEVSERMLRRLLGADIELVVDYGREVPKVIADPGQIDQVVMNLAINARDAMPEGGKLTIETRAIEVDGEYIAEHFGAEPGRYALLAVSDTGVGMDGETQARIFEPYFTTKEPGKGTGLGLSTVFGIVRQSGGMIWVYSEPGAGTTFKIYLPQARGAATGPLTRRPVPTRLEGTETILVTEDQAQVREVAATILRRFGYHVLLAANAGEALLISEQHPRPIHLLLTDIIMPRMRGPELAERLKAMRPGLRVLYMSGYTDTSVIQHALIDPDVAFVQKPIVPQRLGERVRAVLDRESVNGD